MRNHRLGISVEYFSAEAPVDNLTRLRSRAHTLVGPE